MLFLTDDDVRAVFDWGAAVETLRAAYATPMSPAMAPPRAIASTKGVWLRTMSGIAPRQNLMGSKTIAVSTADHRASYLISLFDARTAELRALLDGNAVTGFRTAATSAVAIDALVPPGPLRVAVIGSGFEAGNHVCALAAIRKIHDLRVYSPRETSRSRFVAVHASQADAVRAVESAAQAVDGADLIVCAARARNEEPALHASWLTRDVTIVSIGSTTPDQRELDAGIIARADLLVVDAVEEVTEGTGDMLAARRAGIAFDDKLVSLFDLIGGRVEPQRIAGTIVYKSAGAALQDLAVAGMCLERAIQSGRGTRIAPGVVPVQK